MHSLLNAICSPEAINGKALSVVMQQFWLAEVRSVNCHNYASVSIIWDSPKVETGHTWGEHPMG